MQKLAVPGVMGYQHPQQQAYQQQAQAYASAYGQQQAYGAYGQPQWPSVQQQPVLNHRPASRPHSQQQQQRPPVQQRPLMVRGGAGAGPRSGYGQ